MQYRRRIDSDLDSLLESQDKVLTNMRLVNQNFKKIEIPLNKVKFLLMSEEELAKQGQGSSVNSKYARSQSDFTEALERERQAE